MKRIVAWTILCLVAFATCVAFGWGMAASIGWLGCLNFIAVAVALSIFVSVLMWAVRNT